jgi:hypothetical protein
MMSEEVIQKAQELIPLVARQMTLQHPVDLMRHIYKIPVRWVAEVFRVESGIVCAVNSRQLEDALNKPEVYSVFIPKGAGLNLEIIQRIIDRSALRKTVYIETT